MGDLLLLALDVGTSSTRAAFFDEAANRIPGTLVQENYELVTTPDGGAELPPAILLGAARKCLSGVLAAYRANPKLHGRAIAGLGVSCFWHSLIGVDAQAHPLTNVLTWADSRCRADAAQLRTEFPESETHARTGCMQRASFWPAKLRWLRRTRAREFGQVAQWMSPAEWLQLMLAGDASCAIGMATATGLFNPTTLRWDAELLDACAVQENQLRTVADIPTLIGGPLARDFPELKGVPWFPGIGDGAASNLGSGATQPGLAAINVGTSAALRVMRAGEAARAPLGLFAYRVDAARFLIGGPVSNAGNLRAWCLRELQLPDEAALEEKLAARPGPVSGLSVLPFWTAERAPTWNEDAVGAIHGISQHTTALDLLQAITEATYQRIARIADLVLTTEAQPPKFIVSGGIQHSPAALQRLSDVLGHPVYPNDEMEASLRGAAIFALEQLGHAPPPLDLAEPLLPRTKYVAEYAAARIAQRQLEEALTPRSGAPPV